MKGEKKSRKARQLDSLTNLNLKTRSRMKVKFRLKKHNPDYPLLVFDC